MKRSTIGSVIVGLLYCSTPRVEAAEGLLTIDALLDIKHPSKATWSPDGSRIAFVWDRAGVQNVYVVSAEAGSPEPVTTFEEGLIDALFWDADGRSIFSAKDGDLWQVSTSAQPSGR